MSERSVPFAVRRVDDGAQFELHTVYRRAEDKLGDVVSPDGRDVYTPDEVNFYFADEPDRPMRIVGEE